MRVPLLGLALLASCASSRAEAPASASGTRTVRMGVSPLPPRLSTAEVLRTADEMSRHADAALMVLDIPWAAFLADTSAAHFVRRDDPGVLLAIRELLSYLPSNNLDDPPKRASREPVAASRDLDGFIPEEPDKPYDMAEFIRAVADGGEFLEVHAAFARNLIVGFVRLGGRPIPAQGSVLRRGHGAAPRRP